MNKKMFVMFVMAILLSSSVFALGITPGRKTYDYEPGGQRSFEFSVLNTEDKDMNLIVLIEGELNESIAVSEVSFKMAATDNEKKLTYKFEMLPDLTPGLHIGKVVVVQLPEKSPTSDAFVGAVVGVATEIFVHVPFPGKYAETELNINGPNKNGIINFVMPVHNRGDLDLVRVRGTVDIFTSLNEKITTIDSEEVSLLSQQRKDVVAQWDSSSAAPGPYRAVATILYDEETVMLEKEFNVGKRILEVQGIEVNDFSLGDIAKFEMLVENKWSDIINGAFAQMLVYNDAGDVMADFKSQTYDIPPLEKILMIAFWDTGGVREGTYDSSLFLKYDDQSEQQVLKLEVRENEINVIGVGYVISKGDGGSGLGLDNGLVIILITVIVVLVIINVLWFLVIRKRLKGRGK